MPPNLIPAPADFVFGLDPIKKQLSSSLIAQRKTVTVAMKKLCAQAVFQFREPMACGDRRDAGLCRPTGDAAMTDHATKASRSGMLYIRILQTLISTIGSLYENLDDYSAAQFKEWRKE